MIGGAVASERRLGRAPDVLREELAAWTFLASPQRNICRPRGFGIDVCCNTLPVMPRDMLSNRVGAFHIFGVLSSHRIDIAPESDRDQHD